MKSEQSKNLKIGQRVAWLGSAEDQGIVITSDWSGVQIAWDNGKRQFYHHHNMDEVEVCES